MTNLMSTSNRRAMPMGSRPRHLGKRTRFAWDFDPFAVLDPIWSPGQFQNVIRLWRLLTVESLTRPWSPSQLHIGFPESGRGKYIEAEPPEQGGRLVQGVT